MCQHQLVGTSGKHQDKTKKPSFRQVVHSLPDYSQEPPAHRALSYCPVPSSCIWLLSQIYLQRTTTFCHHTDVLEPGTKVRHRNSHGEAVLSSPAVWVPYFSRGRTPRGAYVPPKSVLCFFLFTRQWQCLPALCSTSSQKLPKTQCKTACNAKLPKTPSQRAHSLLPSDFDAVKSYLRQVLDLK